MKKFIVTLAAIAACTLTMLASDPLEGLRLVDAAQFRLINNGFDPALKNTPYERLPKVLKDSTVADLWHRSTNSSGMAVRFATDSKVLGVRYRLTNNFHMNHMADSGTKGVDLYRMSDKGKWLYVNTLRPKNDSIQSGVLVKNMDGGMHEYMIYLPLYDGIRWMEIAVEQGASIGAPEVDSPRKSAGKVVFYGTSILQGGCASRTGMSPTAMIQRDLNIECVNIGISGQGKMYFPMAHAMASIEDAAAYVIDPVPNCTLGQCDTLTYDFVNILRKAHPDTPIIMVEGPMYPYWKFDSYFKKYLPQKNEAFHKNYLRLRKESPRNLYYVDCEGLTGPDEEGTVDGVHLTDYGFRAYADKIGKVLKKVLKKTR